MLPPAATSETSDAMAAMVAVNFIVESEDWLWRARSRGVDAEVETRREF